MQNNENEVIYLYLDDIIPNRFQPRQVFDERALKELAISIKEHGIIQPIIVRNIGNKYEIIAGERRYKASALAGLTKIPAIVRNLDDKESSKVALLENLQRKNLNPIEEARTYQKILELDQMTQEQLAKTMGKSQSAVANKLRLLSLTEEVQDALLKEQISERHARALLAVSDPYNQKELLKEVITKKMTVRELEEKLKPQEPITDAEIDSLLQAAPVPVEETSSMESTPSNVSIDYNTPPKFIDYGQVPSPTTPMVTPNSMEEQDPLLSSNAPSTSQLDDLLNSSSTPQDSTFDMGNGFKFFQPMENETNQETTRKEQEDAANIIPTPGISLEPFSNNSSTIDSTTPTSMDSLLAEVEKDTPIVEPSIHMNSNGQQEDDDIPYLDTYNNPFARNPIFSDDVQKIEGIKQQEEELRPKYDFNGSIELIRNSIKDIENSGFKVDVEEMNFDRNYQIVIKIVKE